MRVVQILKKNNSPIYLMTKKPLKGRDISKSLFFFASNFFLFQNYNYQQLLFSVPGKKFRSYKLLLSQKLIAVTAREFLFVVYFYKSFLRFWLVWAKIILH